MHARADVTPALTFICAYAPADTHCYFHDSRCSACSYHSVIAH